MHEARRPRFGVTEGAAVAGLLLLAYGLHLIWPPLAPTVSGALLLAGAAAGAVRARGR